MHLAAVRVGELDFELMAKASERGIAKARYIMIGGFLGAGKTTAVGKLAQYLSDQGRRVGLITNDQGSHLVDTTLLRAQGKAADFALWDIAHPRDLCYSFGRNPCQGVVTGGDYHRFGDQ